MWEVPWQAMKTKTLTIQLNDEQLPILPVELEAHLSFTTHADGNELELTGNRAGLLFEAGDDIDDLMMLCEADITSKNEARKQKFLDNFKLVRQKLKDLEEKDRIRNFQPPVDGEEIMRIFDLQPCREIGSLKSSIKDAILDGIIPNEHDAALEHMLKKAKSMGLTPKNL
jgi:hypothetical protein